VPVPIPSIILIGPLATGKTTIGKLIGDTLGLPWIELDELRWGYKAEIGYDPEKAAQLGREGGYSAVGAYWKPFELHVVERVLQDYPTDHVISFGAGNSVYPDPAMLARAKAALAAFPNVILLLPSPDADESLRITGERFRAIVPDIAEKDFAEVMQINRSFVEHPSNATLATITAYTLGKTPAETCAEIVQRLELPRTSN
jgi:shikimate kinase